MTGRGVRDHLLQALEQVACRAKAGHRPHRADDQASQPAVRAPVRRRHLEPARQLPIDVRRVRAPLRDAGFGAGLVLDQVLDERVHLGLEVAHAVEHVLEPARGRKGVLESLHELHRIAVLDGADSGERTRGARRLLHCEVEHGRVVALEDQAEVAAVANGRLELAAPAHGAAVGGEQPLQVGVEPDPARLPRGGHAQERRCRQQQPGPRLRGPEDRAHHTLEHVTSRSARRRPPPGTGRGSRTPRRGAARPSRPPTAAAIRMPEPARRPRSPRP